MRTLVGGLLFVAAFASAAEADVTSSEMRAYCRPVLGARELNTAPPNTLEVGYCLGAFQAMDRAIQYENLTHKAGDQRLFNVCPPPAKTTIVENIEVFARVFDKHPKFDKGSPGRLVCICSACSAGDLALPWR